MYEYFIGSIWVFIIWLFFFLISPKLRKEILLSSFIMLPLALTEPIFVPEYWNPSTLFNLASTTGFDIESFIFVFAIGGISAVVYEVVFKTKHTKISLKMHSKKHNFHRLVLITPVIILGLLHFLTDLNPIYYFSIALLAGVVATYFCRPDLIREMLLGGSIFLFLYFISFVAFNLVFPNFVDNTWNLKSISGIKILSVPLEELMFALTVGMFWSSLYEHIYGYRLRK